MIKREVRVGRLKKSLALFSASVMAFGGLIATAVQGEEAHAAEGDTPMIMSPIASSVNSGGAETPLYSQHGLESDFENDENGGTEDLVLNEGELYDDFAINDEGNIVEDETPGIDESISPEPALLENVSQESSISKLVDGTARMFNFFGDEEGAPSTPGLPSSIEMTPRSLPGGINGTWGIYGNAIKNPYMAMGFYQGTSYMGYCAFSDRIAPPYSYNHGSYITNRPTKYTKVKTLSPSNYSITTSNPYGVQFRDVNNFRAAAFMLNVYGVQFNYNIAVATDAGLINFTNKSSDKTIRSKTWKNAYNVPKVEQIVNNGHRYRGPYTLVASTPKISTSSNGKQTGTATFGLKSGSGNYLVNGLGITVNAKLTNATFSDGSTSKNFNPGNQTISFNVKTPGQPVKIVYTGQNLPDDTIGLYTPNTGSVHQPIIVPNKTKTKITKEVSVTTAFNPSVSTTAALDAANSTVKDTVNITGGAPNSSITATSVLYYAGTAKPAQSATVPSGAKEIATKTNTVPLNGSGAGTINVPAVDISKEKAGYYTWVITTSGTTANNKVVTPYGVPAETVYFAPYKPQTSTGVTLSKQAANGSYTVTDTVAVSKGKPNATVNVYGQLYYHGTTKPSQVASVPGSAKKFGSEVTKSVKLNASGAANVTLPTVTIPATEAKGYYTWVTRVTGTDVENYTSAYGIPSETFLFPGKSDVKVSTSTTSPTLSGTNYIVNDTINITGSPNLAGISVKSELYYHGTSKPSEVNSVPSGKTVVAGSTNTQTVKLDAQGKATVKTPNFTVTKLNTGYYTWVTTVSGTPINTYTSKYGTPSETFSHTKTAPTIVTQATKGTFDQTKATFKDSISISKGIPNDTVTVKSEAFYSKTKPTQSTDIPPAANSIGSVQNSKKLDANGTGALVATVTPDRSSMTESGYITWVTTLSGSNIDTSSTPYGISSETIEWPGAKAGVTTQTSEASFANGAVTVEDTMFITNSVAGSKGEATFQLYYHGTSKPVDVKTVPSGAKKVGSLVTKEFTIDSSGNATVSSGKVTVPTAQKGYYTWVATYGLETEKEFEGAIGVTPASYYGYGSAAWTTDGYWIVGPDDTTTKAKNISGTIKGVTGVSPASINGSGVWTTDGYYIVKPDGITTKAQVSGTVLGATGDYPASGGSGVWTTDGYYIVKPDGITTKAKYISGTIKGIIGADPASGGSGVWTTDGYYIVKPDGTTTKAQVSGTVLGATGDFPAADAGSGVWTTAGYYIVKLDSTGAVAIRAQNISGTILGATGAWPATLGSGSGVWTTGGYYIVNSNGGTITTNKAQNISGTIKGVTGVTPANINGSGVWTTDGYYIVNSNDGTITTTKAQVSGTVLGATGNSPAAILGGSGVWTTGGYWIVKPDGTTTKAQVSGTVLGATGDFPAAYSAGSGVWATDGYYLVDLNGASTKVNIINTIIDSNVLNYGVPSETFNWAGITAPSNIETEANNPVINYSNKTLQLSDNIYISGGVPGDTVRATAKLYYAGANKPSSTASVPSQAELIKTLPSKTLVLDNNGSASFTTDIVQLNPVTAKAGYYTWVLTTESPTDLYPAKTSNYGISGETVYFEGPTTPSIATSSNDILWSGDTASLTDAISLSGGTPGLKYDVQAKLYRSEAEPNLSVTIPSSATLVGTTANTQVTIEEDGTAEMTSGSISLPTGPLGGPQPGYYTWVVTAKGVDVPSQTVTSFYGEPAETVYWEGWLTPTLTTAASTNGVSASDSIILTEGSPGRKVTATAQLYYAGKDAPKQGGSIPSSAEKVGEPFTKEVTLDSDGTVTLETNSVTLPQDAGLGQAKVGYYTWVVSVEGIGIEDYDSDFGIPDETFNIEGPEENPVLLTTVTTSNNSLSKETNEEGVLLLASGDRVREEISIVGDSLKKFPTDVTSTLYGPYLGETTPEEVNPSKDPKFFETVTHISEEGTYHSQYSPEITEPGFYTWVYSFPGVSITSDDGTEYIIYEGITDNTVYSEESARLLYSFETNTEASLDGPPLTGVNASDKVTVSGYPPNTEITLTSNLWGPYVDKPVLADDPLESLTYEELSDPDDPNSETVEVKSAPQYATVETTVTTNAKGEATFTVNRVLQTDSKGEVTEQPIEMLEGGWYSWTDSSEGVPGLTNPWKSKFGIESETFYINSAVTATSNGNAKNGEKVFDTFNITGPIIDGNVTFDLYKKGNGDEKTDTLFYTEKDVKADFVPCENEGENEERNETKETIKDCKQISSTAITIGDNTIKTEGNQEWEPGTYYWRGRFNNGGNEIFRDSPRLINETFRYFTAVSDATPFVAVGKPFHDTLTLNGGMGIGWEVTFNLFKKGDGGVETDTQVYLDALGEWELIDEGPDKQWVPKIIPVLTPEEEGAEIPGTLTKIIKSPEVTVDEAGEYYWVSKVTQGGMIPEELYSDSPRMDNETTRVAPKITTKTKPVAAISEEIFDTAILDGDAPEGSTIVFELWKQGGGDVSTDTKVNTSKPVAVKAAGEYDSPKLKVTKTGVYYWVEKLISPDGDELSSGEPRVPDETVYIPEIGTSAAGEGGEKVLEPGEKTTIIDTVKFDNLRPGETYTMKGALHYKDGEPVLVDGKPVTAEKEFVPETASGIVDIVFEFATNDLILKGIVVYEELFYGDTVIANHKDPEDPEQTVKIWFKPPTVTTQTKPLTTVGEEIFDTAVVDGKTPEGAELAFELWEQGEGDIKTDKLVITTNPVPVNGSGSYDSPKLKVTKPGIYYWVEVLSAPDEDAPDNPVEITRGKPRVPGETTYVPEIGTQATGIDGEKTINPNEKMVIVDTVKFENLRPGETYTMEGTLHYKDGSPVKVDGKPVTAIKEFVPDAPSGTVEITFEFDSTDLMLKGIVVYEELFYGETVIADHKDPEDPEQTVKVWFKPPEVTTQTKPLATVGEEIFDTALVEGQTPSGTEAKFELWQQGDGDVSTDKLILTTSAVPVDGSGSYDSPKVKINQSGIYYWVEVLSAPDEDAPDNPVEITRGKPRVPGETTYVPEIRTSAAGEGVEKEIKPSEKTIIVDTIKFESLRPGETYTMSGTLHFKDGSPVLINGKPVTAEKEFVPETASGIVDVVFEFDARELLSKEIVVYEELFYGETVIADHKDPEDPEQTVKIYGLDFYLEKVSGSDLTSNESGVKQGDRLAGSEWSLYDSANNFLSNGVKVGREAPAGSVIVFENLEPGEYRLEEDKAPSGYIKLDKPITITISQDGKVVASEPMRVNMGSEVLMGTVANNPVENPGEPNSPGGPNETTSLIVPTGTKIALGVLGVIILGGGIIILGLSKKRRKS